MSPAEIDGVLKVLEQIGFEGEYVVQNYVHSSGVKKSEAESLRVPERGEIEPVLRRLPKGVSMRLEWR